MDEFAQSRGDDDLFADEFEPVPAPDVQPAGHSNETARGISTHKSPAPKPSYANPPPGPRTRGTATATVNASASDRGRRQRGREGGQGRGEGRGAGRGGEERRVGGGQRGGGRGGGGGGGGGLEGLAASRYASDAAPSTPDENKSELQPQPQASITPPTDNDQISPTTVPASSSTDVPPPTAAQAEPESGTPGTEKPLLRTQAVRGDRSATGGPAHKKLTEEELTEKLEKMKIINAQKAERFRLSEADSAAFAQKEKEMAQKRAAEQKATRHQDMERAKNRQRKLQAQGGREWDSEKVESDIVDGRGRGRSSEYVRVGMGVLSEEA